MPNKYNKYNKYKYICRSAPLAAALITAAVFAGCSLIGTDRVTYDSDAGAAVSETSEGIAEESMTAAPEETLAFLPDESDTAVQDNAYAAEGPGSHYSSELEPVYPSETSSYVTYGPGGPLDRSASIKSEDYIDVGVSPDDTEAAAEALSEEGPQIAAETAGASEKNLAAAVYTEETVSADAALTVSQTVPDKPVEYVQWQSCFIEGDNIVITGHMDGGITDPNTEMGADPNLYLLELEPYEDSIAGHRMIASAVKATDMTFTVPLNEGTKNDRLYNKFILCLWTGSTYIEVSDTISVTNPEAIANNTKAYQEPLSKKGLMIEISQISDAMSLGVHNVIISIPFDTLIGEGIDYEYDGRTYHFNKDVVAAYDKTISMFSNKSLNVSAILLNRYNANTPELFYPGTVDSAGIMYHAFNAATEEGYNYIKAIASFLASRYGGTDPDCGRIQEWIIGNEINNQTWNYLGPMDMDTYVKEYVRAFRVFYNAIRSSQANARVYFSLDNNWNMGNDDKLTYTAKGILTAVAKEISAHGNIDWGLGYHPYSLPMIEPEFWDDFSTGYVSWSVDTGVVNFANLSVLTDYMQQSFMLDTSGSVRHITLSEQGFTSESYTRGTVEELQAAAFAYAYYIADSNPYIDTFMLSRQIDAPSELKQSLAFGLWTTTATEDVNILPDKKKYIWNVFKNIDKQSTTLEYTEFAKSIIGISRWSDVIPDFKWRRQELNGS